VSPGVEEGSTCRVRAGSSQARTVFPPSEGWESWAPNWGDPPLFPCFLRQMDEGDVVLLVTMLAVFLAGWFVGVLRARAPQPADRTSTPTPSPEAPDLPAAASALGSRDASPEAVGPPASGPNGLRHRTVLVQSPVTYKRWLAQPRFQPLPDDGHGCWPE